MKHKKPKLLISLLLVTAVLTGSLMLLSNRMRDTTPTRPIGVDQSTGGVQDTASKDGSEHTGSVDSERIRHASASITDIDAPKRTDTATAPKQASLKESVAIEYSYRALQQPNDPFYLNQPTRWSATSTNLPGAWSLTTGSPVTIAVIDTGFALEHEDLETQWHHNTGESGALATNGIDDDSNGYVDDWRGWNFYGRYNPTTQIYTANNAPLAGQSGDDIRYAEWAQISGSESGDPFAAVAHGTSVAGLAGAATNNGLGIATANWNVTIMPLQALGDSGEGWTSDIVSAVHYAVDNGASIISMSLGGDQDDPALEAAINYAYEQGVAVIAAAGNCGTGTEGGCDPAKPGAMSYPALYSRVLAVGATNSADQRSSFSSHGPALDIVAPGEGTLVSPTIYRPIDPATSKPSLNAALFDYNTRYATPLYGTSFSTPVVASIASLIKSVKPTYTVDELTALVNGSARRLPANMGTAIYTEQYGHGIIDAANISTVAKALATTPEATPLLMQTGDYRSEHSVGTTLMSSGCKVAPSTYCTVRLTQTDSDIDRYLPYKPADVNGTTGWQWNGAILGKGEWEVRSIQNNTRSAAYLLFNK